MGKTVGIIGYGNTGTAFARKLAGFGCNVLAYDKYKQDYSDDFVHEVSLETIYAESEILSIHIPLTDETRGWLSYDFFSKFHQPIWFLNLSRGGIVVQSDLFQLLKEGKVCSAALDVLENEKLSTYTEAEREELDRLASLPNVILTPHIGGWTFESLDRINDRIAETIRDFLNRR